eukprot:924033-Prorocentrum_lima.AAC.1
MTQAACLRLSDRTVLAQEPGQWHMGVSRRMLLRNIKSWGGKSKYKGAMIHTWSGGAWTQD